MIRRPPRSTRTDTLCPYTTLFRSRPHFGHFGEQAYQNWIPSSLGLEAGISRREAGQHALHLSLKLRGSILLHHGLQLPMRAKHAAIKPQSLWPHRVDVVAQLSQRLEPDTDGLALSKLGRVTHHQQPFQVGVILRVRSEERRVGKECGCTCRTECAPD